MASLWGGRFEKDMDELVKKYNASIFFDQRMYNEDIDGSIAHVTMLGRQGIVSEEEIEQIIAGLKEIKQEIADGKIVFNVDDEDIHMGVESRLIKKIGDVGKKLHTSRSRNDQCQVDTRLYLRKEIYEIFICQVTMVGISAGIVASVLGIVSARSVVDWIHQYMLLPTSIWSGEYVLVHFCGGAVLTLLISGITVIFLLRKVAKISPQETMANGDV